MAVYKVDASGHAPKGATVNDYIETAGGTYQIVDGSRYAGMSKEQLAQAGVGYNPVSGLYSKRYLQMLLRLLLLDLIQTNGRSHL